VVDEGETLNPGPAAEGRMGAWVLVAPRLRMARLWAAEKLALYADELRRVWRRNA